MCFWFTLQARALTAQTAETDAIRFLVGTQSLKFDNQVGKNMAEMNRLDCKAVYDRMPQTPLVLLMYFILFFLMTTDCAHMLQPHELCLER